MALVRERAVDDNIFQTLALEARTRTLPELLFTTLGGGLDAGFLAWQHPSLSWLAAGCATVAAYGLWGILDRATQVAENRADPNRRHVMELAGVRDLTAIAGTGMGVWTVLSFMAAALANWQH